MCMIDNGDTYVVCHRRWRRAVKEHQCSECHRTIQPGERYEYGTGLFDGRWNTNKLCAHCHSAASWLMITCHGYMDGGVLEDLSDHYHNHDRTMLDGWVFLLRSIVGMERRWRRFDGTGLMAVPRGFRPTKAEAA